MESLNDEIDLNVDFIAVLVVVSTQLDGAKWLITAAAHDHYLLSRSVGFNKPRD